MTLEIVVTRFYQRAVELTECRPDKDWRWFASTAVAFKWLERCAERGVSVDPSWRITS